MADSEEIEEATGLDHGAVPDAAKLISTEIMRSIIRNTLLEKDE
jgi:hypothetical protein